MLKTKFRIEKGNINPTKNQAGTFDDALRTDSNNEERLSKSPAAKKKRELNIKMPCFFFDNNKESLSFFSKLLFHRKVINLAVNIIE